MTDKELLTLAAKAACVNADKSKTNGAPPCNDGFDLAGNLVTDWHNVLRWNPLTDDGAAFRLASDLHISVRSAALVNGDRSALRGHVYAGDMKEAFSGDRAAMYAAARRAIVRAAAEIGRVI